MYLLTHQPGSQSLWMLHIVKAPLNKDSAHDHKQWIIHALALLQREASVWAVPFIQAIESNTTTMAAATAIAPGGVPVVITPFPFRENWETFVTKFKTRFQASR